MRYLKKFNEANQTNKEIALAEYVIHKRMDYAQKYNPVVYDVIKDALESSKEMLGIEDFRTSGDGILTRVGKLEKNDYIDFKNMDITRYTKVLSNNLDIFFLVYMNVAFEELISPKDTLRYSNFFTIKANKLIDNDLLMLN